MSSPILKKEGGLTYKFINEAEENAEHIPAYETKLAKEVLYRDKRLATRFDVYTKTKDQDIPQVIEQFFEANQQRYIEQDGK